MSTEPATASGQPYAPPAADVIDASDPTTVVVTTRAGRVFRIPRGLPPDGAPPEGAVPPALFDALSPAARGALEVAEDLRASHARPAVYTEHLLVGLLLEGGSPGRALLERARVTLADVRTRLQAVGLDAIDTLVEPDGRVAAVLPPRGDRTPLRAFPPLSAHAALAFATAARLAGWDPARPAARPVGARHLLSAVAGLDAAQAVRLFPDLWEWVEPVLADAARDGTAGEPAARTVEDAVESAVDVPVAIHELTDDQLQALVGSLTASTRTALGIADRLRGGEPVRMQHLLVGLYVEHGGHQWHAFDAAGLGPDRLVALLRDFELDLGPPAAEGSSGTRIRVPSALPVDQIPPLAPKVRLALSAAAFAAGWSPPPTLGAPMVRARHALTGILSVRESRVVAALAPARSELVRALAERIDQDVAAGQFPAELASEEHRRLDVLLADPPGVVFQPLDGAPATTPAPAPAPPLEQAPPVSLVGAGRGGANDRTEGDDQLGFAYYVGAFAELIDSPDTRPPLTIGIFGSWGAGKSFLLAKLKETVRARSARLRPSELRAVGRRLRRALRGEKPPERERSFVYCVDFNAWEYNAAPQIWPRLVRRVLDGVESSVRFRERPGRWLATRAARTGRNLWRLVHDGWKDVIAWAVLGIALAALVTWDVPGARTSLFEFVVGQPIDDKLNLSLLLGGLGALAKLLKDALLAPIGRWVTAMLADGRGYGLESDAMSAVRRDLELLDQRLAAEGSRILIVIDDLDRCEPEKAVEMLQAINLLLDRPSFIMCLGIDARVVTAAVERHYRELLGPAGITGYEYLDKIIQIPFSIPEPSPTDLADFVTLQMGRTLGPPLPARRPAPAATAPSGAVAPDGVHTSGDGAPPDGPAATGSERARPAPTPPTSPDSRPTLPAADRTPVVERSPSIVDTVAAVAGALTEVGPGTGLIDRATGRAIGEVAAGILDAEPEVPEALSFTAAEEQAFRAVTPYLRRNPRHVKRLVNVYALVRSLATLRKERHILADPGATVRWLTLCGQWPYATRHVLRAVADIERGDAPPLVGPMPPLAELLGRVVAALDPARRRRFDHSAELLDDLVATSGDLSWDELLVLRRYTLNFNPALESELRATDGAAPRASAEG